MNILVIGGSGFIGSHISDELTFRGHNVTIFDANSSKWISDNQKMVIGSISDIDALSDEISKSDVVYHMAAIADIAEADQDPIRTITDNILGSVNIVNLCAKHNARLMYGSTVYVYSKHGSFYRASKQSVEILIEVFHEKFNLDYTILRYGSLYGPRAQQWNGLKRIVSEIVHNKKIIFGGTGNEKREDIHVVDAAKMSVDVLDDKYKQKAVTLTGIQVLTQSELIQMIQEVIGYDVLVEYNSDSKSHNHYKLTPYQYTPKSSVKIISREYVDIGEGILELVSDLDQE